MFLGECLQSSYGAFTEVLDNVDMGFEDGDVWSQTSPKSVRLKDDIRGIIIHTIGKSKQVRGIGQVRGDDDV